MTTRPKSIGGFSVLLVLPILFSMGCARVPVREISDARVLMEAAKSSCAGAYMTEEMKEGEAKIRQIDDGLQEKTPRSNRELKRLALEVQRLSKKMINRSGRIKADLYEQVQRQIVAAIKEIHEGEKAEANRYARKAYMLAIENVREARELSQDECLYREALEKSSESIENAKASSREAAAFKAELEKNLPAYHIVREGETLKSIAKESPLYKNESYWEIIYKANRDQIRDPDSLYPGQQIFLPRIK